MDANKDANKDANDTKQQVSINAVAGTTSIPGAVPAVDASSMKSQQAFQKTNLTNGQSYYLEHHQPLQLPSSLFELESESSKRAAAKSRNVKAEAKLKQEGNAKKQTLTDEKLKERAARAERQENRRKRSQELESVSSERAAGKSRNEKAEAKLKQQGKAKKQTLTDEKIKERAARAERQENRRERIVARTAGEATKTAAKNVSPSQEAEKDHVSSMKGKKKNNLTSGPSYYPEDDQPLQLPSSFELESVSSEIAAAKSRNEKAEAKLKHKSKAKKLTSTEKQIKSAACSDKQKNRRDRIVARTTGEVTKPPNKSVSPSQEADQDHGDEDEENPGAVRVAGMNPMDLKQLLKRMVFQWREMIRPVAWME
jgi:IgA-specific serine endopeptidase